MNTNKVSTSKTMMLLWLAVLVPAFASAQTPPVPVAPKAPVVIPPVAAAPVLPELMQLPGIPPRALEANVLELEAALARAEAAMATSVVSIDLPGVLAQAEAARGLAPAAALSIERLDLSAVLAGAEAARALAPVAAGAVTLAQGATGVGAGARADALREYELARTWPQSKEASEAREQSLYSRAQSYLDQNRWEQAAAAFDQVVQLNGRKADGALYWKAYAQSRQGKRSEALATIDTLKTSHPKSRYLSDAKALEVEVRQASGQAVTAEGQTDEDLKVIILSNMVHQDPERTVPAIEKLLQGTSSPRVKERALFVLAQANTPRSREILASVAKGQGNPDMQLKAVRYLGIYGGETNRQLLADVYASSGDSDVKRSVLRALMTSRDTARLLQVARSESSPELRADAIRYLGAAGANTEVWQLYQSESSPEVKVQIIRALMSAEASGRLIDIARAEKDVKIRETAIRQLGIMKSEEVGKELTALYKTEKDKSVRKAIINALFVQQNATALVAAARSETDPEMKAELVKKLSVMKSKEATDYLMELLK